MTDKEIAKWIMPSDFPRQYIQLGGLSYRVLMDFEDKTFHTLVTVDCFSSYYMYDCVFDNDKKAFKKEEVYGGLYSITKSQEFYAP